MKRRGNQKNEREKGRRKAIEKGPQREWEKEDKARKKKKR